MNLKQINLIIVILLLIPIVSARMYISDYYDPDLIPVEEKSYPLIATYDLVFYIWTNTAGNHTLYLELTNPYGVTYAVFSREIHGGKAHYFVVPIAGTSITRFGLNGTWTASYYFESPKLGGERRNFTLVR